MEADRWKEMAAKAATDFVRDNMKVGLGSGSTLNLAVRALAEKKFRNVRFAASSIATERLVTELGLSLDSLDNCSVLDVVIDGADEVDPNFNLIKGGGGAHTREKIVASAAKKVIIIVDSRKMVKRLGTRMPVPVEVLPFGRKLTMSRLAKLGGKPELRTEASGRPFITDNGNYVADVKFEKIPAPARLERVINQLPGVVENGIFAGAADVVVVGHAGGCTKLRNKKDFLNLMRKLKIG